jgi:hypothetical protein
MKAFCHWLLILCVIFAPLSQAGDGPKEDQTPPPRSISTPEVPVLGPDGVVRQGHLEIVTGEVGTPAEAALLETFLQADLARGQQTNPALEAQVGIVESAQKLAVPTNGLGGRALDYLRNIGRDRYRVRFAIARFVVGNQMTLWTLMLSKGVPFWPSLFMGIYNGCVQGGFMLFNPEWQSFILGPSHVRKGLGIEEQTRAGRVMDAMAPALRWLGVELLFVVLAKMALLAIGNHYDIELVPHETFDAFAGFVLFTTLLNTVGEFPWGMTIGLMKQHSVANGGFTPEAEAKARFKSDVRVLGLSGLGTIALMMQQMRLPMGETALKGIALAGWVLYGGTRLFLGKAPQNCADEVKEASAIPPTAGSW